MTMKRRHPPSKAELLARMPRGLRPMLSADEIASLGICHHETFAQIAQGQADWNTMWQYVDSVLAWWWAAQALGAGVAELDAQLQAATRLVERYGRTGRVRFDGPDLQLARDGIGQMDDLARLVDRATAQMATAWSRLEVQRLIAAGRLLAQQNREQAA